MEEGTLGEGGGVQVKFNCLDNRCCESGHGIQFPGQR
jgi:hypothetical protein